MQNIISYTFQNTKIHAFIIESELFFRGSELAKVLGYKNPRQALASHVDKEDVQKLDTLTKGGKQKLSYVNESGMYALILGSEKPEAKQFKKWVTSEVLPSIRKTGGYSLTLTTEQQYQIKEAVNQNAGRTGRTFQTVYRDLYQQFQVPRYQDILAKDFDKAIEYLGYPAKQHQKAPALPHIAEDGRWLVIVRNNIVTHVRNINDYNCINADVFKKLRMQTKQQAEYLLELATRMRVIDGECSNSRLDVPIEESHPKFII
jgi:prophage antirepressor-like protein